MPTLETTAPVSSTPTVESNGHAPKAPKVKKASAKKSSKGKAKKSPAKAKKSAAPRAKKEGLRKPQIRILKCLAKGAELTRSEISEKAPVDAAACVEYIGSDDEAVRKANDKKHFPSLLSLGLVKASKEPLKLKDGSFSEAEGASVYVITAAGKKAFEKASE